MAALPETEVGSKRPVGAGGARQWEQPLGDVLHAKLNRLVGPEPLHLEFDTTDDDFIMALTSKWPRAHGRDDKHLVFDHVGLMKLADSLNRLVRLYALETGHRFVHVLVEARRGVLGVPPWWNDSSCLFVTYGFNTHQGEVCLADDPSSAFARMEWLAEPHRLLMAVGPGTPEHMRSDGDDAWAEVDADHLRALQRWEKQLSQQLARLLSFTVIGDMMSEEAIVDALATMRGYASKVRRSITELTRRRQRGRDGYENDARGLIRSVREIKSSLHRHAANKAMPVQVRTIFRRGLASLATLEQSIHAPASHFSFRSAAVGQRRVSRNAGLVRNMVKAAAIPLETLRNVIVRPTPPGLNSADRFLRSLPTAYAQYAAGKGADKGVEWRPAATVTVRQPASGSVLGIFSDLRGRMADFAAQTIRGISPAQPLAVAGASPERALRQEARATSAGRAPATGVVVIVAGLAMSTGVEHSVGPPGHQQKSPQTAVPPKVRVKRPVRRRKRKVKAKPKLLRHARKSRGFVSFYEDELEPESPKSRRDAAVPLRLRT